MLDFECLTNARFSRRFRVRRHKDGDVMKDSFFRFHNRFAGDHASEPRGRNLRVVEQERLAQELMVEGLAEVKEKRSPRKRSRYFGNKSSRNTGRNQPKVERRNAEVIKNAQGESCERTVRQSRLGTTVRAVVLSADLSPRMRRKLAMQALGITAKKSSAERIRSLLAPEPATQAA